MTALGRETTLQSPPAEVRTAAQGEALDILDSLQSHLALHRSRGSHKLQQGLRKPASGSGDGLVAELRAAVSQSWTGKRWEQRCAALTIAQELVSKGLAEPGFCSSALEICQKLLEDPEHRVRLAVGTCLAALADHQGAAVWESTGRLIIDSIQAHWDRDELLMQHAASFDSPAAFAADSPTAAQQPPAASPSLSAAAVSAASAEKQRPELIQSLLSSSYAVQRPGSGEMRHGTEGWQCLETSFQVLRLAVETLQQRFQPYATCELQQLVLDALLHPNRYVRETAWHAVAALCTHAVDLSGSNSQSQADCATAQAGGESESRHMANIAAVSSNGESSTAAQQDALQGRGQLDFGQQVAQRLQDGLSENWSQVRYAACVAARAFCLAAGEHAPRYFPTVLPHLCYNRHDVAEGVRNYSLETWRLVMRDKGRFWVAQCLSQVVKYYERCARTNNHTTREATCTCWGELAARIDPDAVRTYVPGILRALMASLKDDTWNVRGAACISSGQVVRVFCVESSAFVDSIFPLWVANLDDNVFSVRQDAAAAMSDFVAGCGNSAWDRVLPVLGHMLPRALEEPPAAEAPEQERTKAGPGFKQAEAMFRDNGLLMRKVKDTGGVDYSCGCMDYGFKRTKLPWEASEGAIYLLTAISGDKPAQAAELLPVLAQLSRAQHFLQWQQLQETLWRQLPILARGVGKRAFKPHLEELLEPLFRALCSDSQLCRAAAGSCVGFLRDFLGPSILAGRLNDSQRALMASSPDVPAVAYNHK